MTTRQISETLDDIYGFEATEGFISDVTDKIMPQIEDWQNRPLSEVYPVLYIDAIHYSVRDNGVIRKLAAYVILGISQDGYKEVLTIEVGENESAKYWLSILNGLKNQGLKDILIICADGLTGIKEAISTAYPLRTGGAVFMYQDRSETKYARQLQFCPEPFEKGNFQREEDFAGQDIGCKAVSDKAAAGWERLQHHQNSPGHPPASFSDGSG